MKLNGEVIIGMLLFNSGSKGGQEKKKIFFTELSSRCLVAFTEKYLE